MNRFPPLIEVPGKFLIGLFVLSITVSILGTIGYGIYILGNSIIAYLDSEGIPIWVSVPVFLLIVFFSPTMYNIGNSLVEDIRNDG